MILTPANYPFHRPYPGFVDPDDWRVSHSWGDKRNEAKGITLVSDATSDHLAKHDKHEHPWCKECAYRRFDYENRNSDPEAIAAELKQEAEHEAWLREFKEEHSDGPDEHQSDPDEPEPYHVRECYARTARWLILNDGRTPRDDYDPEADDETGFNDQYLDADQLDDLPTPEPLIDGVLMRHAYGILRGRDGTYKSFVALDWALCLATGKRWQGHHAQTCRVLYIAGEGAYGMAARKRAWEAAWGHSVNPDMFTLRQSSVNLRKAGPALDDLLRRITEGNYGLVIVDTLRRASGGADENSSEMGTIVDNLERIKRATADGSVLAIAHTGKADEDTRGFSGIEDDSDIVWSSKRDAETDGFTLTNRKMKDGPDGLELRLRAKPYGGSLIVSAGDDLALPGEDTTPSQRAILAALGDTFALTGGATATELLDLTGMAKTSFYRARAALLRDGSIQSHPHGNTTRLALPYPTSPTESHPEGRPMTSTFPTSPTESHEAGPVPPSPTPLWGGTVGQRDWEEGTQ